MDFDAVLLANLLPTPQPESAAGGWVDHTW